MAKLSLARRFNNAFASNGSNAIKLLMLTHEAISVAVRPDPTARNWSVLVDILGDQSPASPKEREAIKFIIEHCVQGFTIKKVSSADHYSGLAGVYSKTVDAGFMVNAQGEAPKHVAAYLKTIAGLSDKDYELHGILQSQGFRFDKDSIKTLVFGIEKAKKEPSFDVKKSAKSLAAKLNKFGVSQSVFIGQLSAAMHELEAKNAGGNMEIVGAKPLSDEVLTMLAKTYNENPILDDDEEADADAEAEAIAAE